MFRLTASRPTPHATCPRAGWISVLLLEWLRDAAEPPGPRTHLEDLQPDVQRRAVLDRPVLWELQLVPAADSLQGDLETRKSL